MVIRLFASHLSVALFISSAFLAGCAAPYDQTTDDALTKSQTLEQLSVC
jgi:hypothetical protein